MADDTTPAAEPTVDPQAQPLEQPQVAELKTAPYPLPLVLPGKALISTYALDQTTITALDEAGYFRTPQSSAQANAEFRRKQPSAPGNLYFAGSSALRTFFETAVDPTEQITVLCVGGTTGPKQEQVLDVLLRLLGYSSCFGGSGRMCPLPGMWVVPQLLDVNGARVLLVVVEPVTGKQQYHPKLFALSLFFATAVVHPGRLPTVLYQEVQRTGSLLACETLQKSMSWAFAMLVESASPLQAPSEEDPQPPQQALLLPPLEAQGLDRLFGSKERRSEICQLFAVPEADASALQDKTREIVGQLAPSFGKPKWFMASPADFLAVVERSLKALNEHSALPSVHDLENLVAGCRKQAYARVKKDALQLLQGRVTATATTTAAADVTPEDVHALCATTAGQFSEKLSAIVAITPLPTDDTAGWTIENFTERLTNELQSEIATPLRNRVLEYCKKAIVDAIAQLTHTPFDTKQLFLDEAARLGEDLKARFGKFGEWTEHALAECSGVAETIIAEQRVAVRKETDAAFRRVARMFFSAIDTQMPIAVAAAAATATAATDERQLLLAAFEAALGKKRDNLRFAQFVPPNIDVAREAQEFAACAKIVALQPFMRPLDMREQLQAFTEQLARSLTKELGMLAATIRRAVLTKLLAPDILPPPYSVLTPADIVDKANIDGILAQVPWNVVFSQLRNKFFEASALFDRYCENHGTQDKPAALAKLQRELPIIYNSLVLRICAANSLVEFRVPCANTHEEQYWLGYFAESKFVAAIRGAEPATGGANGKSVRCIALTVPGGAEQYTEFVKDDFGDPQMHVHAAKAMRVFGPKWVLLKFSSAHTTNLAEVVPRLCEQITKCSGVVPLDVMLISPAGAPSCYAVSVAIEDDLIRICTAPITFGSESIWATPCPRLCVTAQDPFAALQSLFSAQCQHPFAVTATPVENQIELSFIAAEHAQCVFDRRTELFGIHASVTLVETKDFAAISAKLWEAQLFTFINTLRSVSDVNAGILTKAWDPVIWLARYREFEAAARARDTSGRNIWRDERLCGMRVLVAASTLRMLLDGEFEQCNRSSNSEELIAVKDIVTIKAPLPLVTSTTKEDIITPCPASPKFAATEVRVTNMDCFELARQLQQRFPDKRVVTLNMANQFQPGGGWIRGRFAQEEGLFFRTALSQSLKKEMYNTPAGFGEFSCIYSRDVAVLRENVTHGFAFLPEDQQWRTDFVTIAAYDLNDPCDKSKPPLPFSEEVAAKMRVKIELLLATCAKNGAEILVLSALGCGAFRNPSQSVAAIFRAVLEQFAGHFSRVYFAILGSREDRKLIDFTSALVDTTPSILEASCTPARSLEATEGAFNVYRPIAGAPQPPTNVQNPICALAGRCPIVDPQHYATTEHPPMCLLGDSCNNHDLMHMHLWCHRQQCPDPLFCEIMRKGSKDIVSAHSNRFTHQILTIDKLEKGDAGLVARFAASCGLDEIACKLLFSNKIDGHILVNVDLNAFRTMGLAYGDAFRLVEGLNALRAPPPAAIALATPHQPRPPRSKFETPICSKLTFSGPLRFPHGFTPMPCKDALLALDPDVLGIPNLREIVEDVERAVASIMAGPNARLLIHSCRLTADEIFAIAAFSYDIGLRGPVENNLFFRLNEILRLRVTKLTSMVECFLFYLISGLQKLPDVKAEVYRGVPASETTIAEFSVGRDIFFAPFVSTTTDPACAAIVAGRDGILLKMRTKHAKAIWPFSIDEDRSELVLLPNSFFVVLEVAKDEAGATTVVLEEKDAAAALQ